MTPFLLLRRIGALALAPLALAPLAPMTGCKGSPKDDAPPVSAEDAEHIHQVAAEMLAVAHEADAKRTRALLAALDTLVPRADLGPCPIAVPVVGTEDRARLGQNEPKDAPVDWRSMRAEQMMVVPRERLATEPSVRRKHVEEMIAFETEGVAREGVAGAEKWIRTYGDVKHDPWELVIVADKSVDPEMVGDGKFREGVIVGRAYVYSFPDDAVVCAADVVARSSDLLTNHNVTTAAGQNFDLVFDLQNEAFREAAKALVRAGPKAGAVGDGGAAHDGGDAASGPKADGGPRGGKN